MERELDSMRGLLSLRARALVTLVFALCAVPAAALAAFPAAAAAESCPNAAFRTGPSLHLPDCRAYEMVTPPFKGGAAVIKAEGISPDGEAVGLSSFAGFGNAEADEGLGGVFYVAQRSGTGWKTVSLTPPMSRFSPFFGEGPLEKKGFGDYDAGRSSDRSAMLWTLLGASPGSVEYYVTRTDGSVVDVGPWFNEGVRLGVPVGTSDDFSHVVVKDPEGLGEYLVGSGNTTLYPLGVENNGKPVDECASQTLSGISRDGSVAFISDSCRGGLFARIDNGLSDARTVAISEPSKEDCAACETAEGVRKPAHLMRASEDGDGSRVFFSTEQPLLEGEGGIYQYDSSAPAGQRVVKAVGSSAGPNTVSISGDGSHIYFIATGVLTPTPNYAGQTAKVGAHNLYFFERDARYPSGRTVFIALLPDNDFSSYFEDSAVLAGVEKGHGSVRPRTTPDGRFLVFLSHGHLTPGDTGTAAQVFEYDAQTNNMVRVSIGQDGFNDNGSLNTYDRLGTVGVFGQRYEDGEYVDPYDPRLAPEGNLTVSADGAYVVFESSVALTSQALNHVLIAEKVGTISIGTIRSVAFAHNVYEYHDGNVYLISDGRDVAATVGDTTSAGGVATVGGLEGVNSSGRDVFLRTADQLLPQDTDTSVDVYDARIGGGFPPAPPAPECTADACQGSLSAAPVLLSPGSEFQAGGENVAAGSLESNAAPKLKAAKQKKPKAKKRARGRKRKAKKAVLPGHRRARR
jgi:hypothetical protein